MREHLLHGLPDGLADDEGLQSEAAKIAFPIAGATTVVAASPRHDRRFRACGNSISTSGTSPMRSNVERRQSHRSELLQTQFASLRGVFVCLANAIARAQPPRWTRHNGRGCGALSFPRDAKKSTSTSKVVSAPLTRGGTAPKHPFGISIHSPEELFYASLLASIWNWEVHFIGNGCATKP
jgi:hypothetical protein